MCEKCPGYARVEFDQARKELMRAVLGWTAEDIRALAKKIEEGQVCPS